MLTCSRPRKTAGNELHAISQKMLPPRRANAGAADAISNDCTANVAPFTSALGMHRSYIPRTKGRRADAVQGTSSAGTRFAYIARMHQVYESACQRPMILACVLPTVAQTKPPTSGG